MEYLSRECRELSVTDIARLLESYQFEPSSLFNTLDELSSGQKARILFAIFSYQKVNTLFFDEPTNHLDIDAQDALLSVIKNFTGTLVVISHDENFLNSFKNSEKITRHWGKGLILKWWGWSNSIRAEDKKWKKSTFIISNSAPHVQV